MDSEAQIVATMHSAIRDLGLDSRTDEQVSNIIGLGLWEAVDNLYPDRDMTFHEDFRDRYRHHWLGSSGSSQLFAGAKEVLYELREMGYQLGIATGKSRVGLDKILVETGLQNMFHATRCADESGSKPHPAMLQDIMETLSVDSICTLMVGDTEYDLEMARSAGAHAIGVACGVHNNERLLLHKPLVILEHVRELSGWLKEQHLAETESNSAAD